MLIGLCGRAGVGKDTAAVVLREVSGGTVASIAFADPMKRFVAEIYDWDRERLWGPSENRNAPDPRYRKVLERLVSNDPDENRTETFFGEGLTAREALQKLGTEWARAIYPDTWVDYAIRVANRLFDGTHSYDPAIGPYPKLDAGSKRTVIEHVAITDVRFANEAAAIKKAGGVLWKIDRPGAGLQGAAGAHASERGLDGIPGDLVLDNHRSLADFRERVQLAYIDLQNDVEAGRFPGNASRR